MHPKPRPPDAPLARVGDAAMDRVPGRTRRARDPPEPDRFFFQAEDGIRDKRSDWSSDVCSSDLAKGQSDERLAEESADLLFHLLVALRQRNLPLSRVMDVLKERRRGK